MIRNEHLAQSRPDPGPGGSSDRYAELHGQFRWRVPEYFNMAQFCCRRWAERADAGQRTAVIEHVPGAGLSSQAQGQNHSYARLHEQANRLAHVLRAQGVQPGERVAIVMPQRFETAVAYMAVLQMGAVAMPLSMLFGPDALAFRLQDSGARLALVDESSVTNVQSIRAQCPDLCCLVGVGDAAAVSDLDYSQTLAAQPAVFEPVSTRADDPAVLIYTSGTTGQPKGALIPHRALIGNLTGFLCSQNWFGFDATLLDDPLQPSTDSQAVLWSPADWAWTGGLMDALLPTLFFGRPIVAYGGRFSPELAFGLMQTHGVTHTFLFPTALKAMMKAYPQPRQHFKLKLQALMSAGESVGDAVFAYCQSQLDVTVNEMFGQTEINYIVGNCAPVQTGAASAQTGWPARPGSMGKAYPGHRVQVIDEAGNECPDGVPGDVAVNRKDVHGDPDPIFFLGYWRNDAATLAKFTGDWCRTGDMAVRDADGYLWYQGRADDVFKSAGYRIGPGEIENCLVKHPAVANAAVVPKPDRERGALVKAYVVLSADFARQRTLAATPADFDKVLVAELQAHVKGQLAPYEYPKEIEFIDQLPMTTTGKVQRRVLRLEEETRARKLGVLN
ncbi:MAG: Acetyl-coenzyme synthetase [Pseudomonadota bacterium]|jgi:acetyl-CoA synthetase